jgi:hypothetical protein
MSRITDGISLEEQLWLMAGVFLTMAVIIVLIEGPRFRRTPMAPIAEPTPQVKRSA